MATVWILLIGLLVVLLLYGDVRASARRRLTAEKAAEWEWSKWPVWSDVEPRGDRIRVLWVDQDYVPWVNAGSEVCTHQINKYLMRRPYKWDVWVAAPGQARVTYEGIRCFDLRDTATFCKVLESTQILCSHSYAYRTTLCTISAKTGIPFAAWIHTDNYANACKKSKHGWSHPGAEGRIWNAFNSDSLLAAGAAATQYAVFIPTVDYREYAVEAAAWKPRYVTLSNVNDNKGGRLLVQLARACPDMEFLGVQGGYSNQIVEKDLPNLTYVPHTNRIKEVYAKTWVQIMPSRYETWGRTAVEAMSSGIPVVVSPTPGLKECCGGAAVYLERDDLEGWVRTLRLLKSDTDFYNSRSKVAVERARALDPKPTLERIEAWLEDTVLPSAASGRSLTALEKNLLFR
jgi:glycosyltransferase involved in cell wall biosynthesis